MTGASFRASLASIHGETTKLRAWRKSADRWTDRRTAFRIYIVDVWGQLVCIIPGKLSYSACVARHTLPLFFMFPSSTITFLHPAFVHRCSIKRVQIT